MSDQVEHVHVDIDAPIPFTVTDKGRRQLRLMQLEDLELDCKHEWEVDLRIGLVCRHCGAGRSTRRQSIPSYLSPRERR
jgi:hypothetical protein